MRFTKVTVLAASIAVVLIASAASAQMACCAGGAGKGAAVWSDLTPEQQKQVTTLRNDFAKKQETLRSDMAKKSIELMELASKEKPDEQAIEKKRQEIWDLQDAMRNEQRSMGTKFRALLTPEQKQKLGPLALDSTNMGACGGCGFGAGCGFAGSKCCGGQPGRL